MDYLLICISSALFSVQFIFQKKFNKTEEIGVKSAFIFMIITCAMRAVFLMFSGGLVLSEINPYSLLMSFLLSLNAMIYVFMSAKAFKYADMAIFSMLAMLGGMALPFAYGIVFAKEELNITKALCFALIAVSIVIGTGATEKKDKKAYIYYVGVFFSNGMNGVLAKMNQSSPSGAGSNTFLMMSALWFVAAGIVPVIIFIKKKSLFTNVKNAMISSAGYTVSSTIGNLFLLIALETLPASVQYPLSTGGCIACSALFSLIQREKLTVRTLISVVIAIAASVMIAIGA